MKNKKNSIYILLTIVIIGFFSLPIQAQVKTDKDTKSPEIGLSLAKQVDVIFSQYDTSSSPGCALAILKDGKIIYKRGYGMASLEYGEPISPTSIFHVASISKQFTAAAILHLAMEGQISLEDDIREYLPGVPDFGHAITFNHLLHHTSGLRDQWDLQRLAGWRSDDVITENDIMEILGRSTDLNFLPGEEFSYSNTGYTLLAMAVKKISGVSLKAFTDSLFFKPLGMINTHFHNDHTEIIPNRTSAYGEQNGRWKIFVPVLDTYGATGLVTTIEDMAKWDENFYTKKVGGAALLKAIQTIGSLNDQTPLIYASGLVVEEYKGHQTVGHPGSDAGYRSNHIRFPDAHFSVILFGNVANMNTVALSQKVADLFIKDNAVSKKQMKVQQDTALKVMAGLYLDHHAKTLLTLTYKEGYLVKGRDTLASMDRGSFLDTKGGSSYNFKQGNTKFSLEVVTPGFKKAVYEKVPQLNWKLERPEAYIGDFYSSQLDIRYKIYIKAGELFVKVPRNEEIKLQPLMKDTFKGGPLFIEFSRNEEGNICAFNATLGRTRNIHFTSLKRPF